MTVERNTDKIKRLEYELERCRQKVDRQEEDGYLIRVTVETPE